MPFPLAHPAAVLPLRRFCPRYLSFPALVIGSVCPDAGYCFGGPDAGGFSHRWVGSFGFSLPVGILMLLFIYGIFLPILERLPERFTRTVPQAALKPLGSPLIVVASLLVGSWTHLLWDSFTHTDGWFVQHWPILNALVASMGDRHVRVCHFLWYGSSFAGLIVLFITYDRWQQKTAKGVASTDIHVNWGSALLLAFLLVPIEFIHHLLHGAPGRYLVLALTLMVVIGFALKFRPSQKEPPSTDSIAAKDSDLIASPPGDTLPR
jgi:hypothetical protein